MLEGLLEWLGLCELNNFTVDDCAGIALADQIFEKVDELALFLIDELREYLKAGSLFKLKNLIDNLLRRLLDNLLAAFCTVRHSNASPK